MELDQTRIAIRERGFLELMDLSLTVIRGHAGALLVAWLIGVLPMMAVNQVVLFEILQLGDGWAIPSDDPEEMFWQAVGYIGWLTFLVVLEIPVATTLMTLYLGQAMFHDSPGAKRVAADFVPRLPQLVVLQVLGRGVLTMFCCVPCLLLYLLAPYLNEVILLERNSFSTTLKRAQDLHSSNVGLLFARWTASLFFGGVILFPLFYLSLLVIRNVFMGQWEWDHLGYTLGLTVEARVAMWMTVGLFAVVRYLSYLDLRIRREGWEVELQLRAEAARLRARMGEA
ncbi:MAG: hypothetical protein N2C14_09445 [Planctomycetales bacterium]